MRAKNINMNKYRCTGVLFELLVRQVASDTLAGRTISEALNVMKKHFNASTELGKELQLYRAFFDGKPLTEGRAIQFIDIVLDQRKKLNERKLAREKYELIKEIKEKYPLKEFLACKIPEYTVHASIYKTFESESVRSEATKIVNIADVAQARFTLIEHLAGRGAKKSPSTDSEVLREFANQTEDLRMLTYKLLIDKFNEKYANLNEKQKALLREYINNVPASSTLYEYVRAEVPKIKADLAAMGKKTSDKVLQIKLNEVAAQLDAIGAKKTVHDREITALMIAYEIIKEIQS